MHVLDIDALTWTQIAAEGQAPISRSRHTATLVGRNLLIFGGVGGGRPLNDLFVLHTASGSLSGQFWTEPAANGVAPNQRIGHAAAIVDTKVFFFGGHDGKQCLNDVHVLVTMNWRTLNVKGGRPNPRVSCTLNTVGSKLVLLGGAKVLACAPSNVATDNLVERLAAGDKVRITQLGQNGFVYSGDGGGALTFRGELIAHSGFQ